MTAVVWDAPDGVEEWEAAGWSEMGQTRRMMVCVAHLGARAGETVLDYGCGTGRLRAFLPPGVGYVGYDPSPGMLARAARERPGSTLVGEIDGTVTFEHVAAVGPWNLGVEKARAVEEIVWLWGCVAEWTLVASLYRGGDVSCTRWEAGEVAELAASLSPSWTVDAHLPNDLVMVVRR